MVKNRCVPEPTQPTPTEVPDVEPEWIRLTSRGHQSGGLAAGYRGDRVSQPVCLPVWRSGRTGALGCALGADLMVGGLLVNAYISFNLPGAVFLVREYHIWGIVLAVAGGCLLGWAAGLVWRWLSK